MVGFGCDGVRRYCIANGLDILTVLFVVTAKLAARRIYRIAFSVPDLDIDSGIRQKFGEPPGSLRRWCLKWQFGDPVVRDQIDQRVSITQQPGQGAGRFVLVVYPGQQHIFERDAASRLLEVIVGRLQYFGNTRFSIGRDKFVAKFVVRGMQRNGQMVRRGRIGKAPNRRWKPDRRDRDPTRADPQSIRSAYRVERLQDGIQVCQWLPEAHHYDMADPAFGVEQLLKKQYLLNNFAGGQVSLDSVEATCTKCAAHRTADLTAQADGFVPGVVFQKDRFDLTAIGPLDQKFYRSVG